MMRKSIVLFAFCILLTVCIVSAAERPVNPQCLVKGICSVYTPPVYASVDGGKTCQKFGNVCFYKDEWCNNDYAGLPELKEIAKEKCQSVARQMKRFRYRDI